eukprot:403333093
MKRQNPCSIDNLIEDISRDNRLSTQMLMSPCSSLTKKALILSLRNLKNLPITNQENLDFTFQACALAKNLSYKKNLKISIENSQGSTQPDSVPLSQEVEEVKSPAFFNTQSTIQQKSQKNQISEFKQFIVWDDADIYDGQFLTQMDQQLDKIEVHYDDEDIETDDELLHQGRLNSTVDINRLVYLITDGRSRRVDHYHQKSLRLRRNKNPNLVIDVGKYCQNNVIVKAVEDCQKQQAKFQCTNQTWIEDARLLRVRNSNQNQSNLNAASQNQLQNIFV